MCSLAAALPAQLSITIVLTLLVIGVASVAVFSTLVRRWTSRRQWVSLAEWARQRGVRVRSSKLDELPDPLKCLASRDAQVRMQVTDGSMLILQLDTQPDALNEPAPDNSASGGGAAIAVTDRPKWNLLVRRLESGRKYAPAALRPASLPLGRSVIDFYKLAPFHSMSNDRFAVLAENARAAGRLSDSSARALLPPDVGMMMSDEYLLIDFSPRPFDPVELDRMISVAQQVCVMC